MRLSVRSICVTALALILTAASAEGQMAKRVEVTGKAAGTGVKAADEAKLDAKRNAVEQACGLYINAQSETENFKLVKDRILGQAGGYIREFKVVKEWQEGDISYCTIEAVVSVADFERDWALFAQVKEDEGNPRCVIVITEDNDVDDLKPSEANGICQSKLENFFLSKDVQLMDKGVTEDVRGRDLELAAINEDINKMAAVAAAFKADVLVFGRAEAKGGGSVSIGGRDAYRWDITLTVRAVQADSARILASNVYRPRKPHMTTSAACGDDAFARLTDEVAPEVLKDIGEAWRKRATVSRTCRVFWQSCSRKQFKAIQAHLADVRGVERGKEGVKLRELVNDVVESEVSWKYDLNLLADTIEDMEVDGMTFEVVEQSANRLDVRVVQGE
ncbi:MAG: hypothetical protein JSV19_05960 [Phycisphaerales bacterium]|nr:MAG: hypothetical protein JSV19_05960 [Phycisphaerales bacterium]